MVLISIHPFALRRIFLLVLALVGFSKLCFADPVLMAHRYNHDHSRVAGNASSIPTLRLDLAGVTEQNHAGNAAIALEKGANPAFAANSMRFGVQAWDLRPETWAASMSLSPETAATN